MIFYQEFQHYHLVKLLDCQVWLKLIQYKMEEKNITKSDEEKDLGIIIDGKLKFQQHINIQTKKANQRQG